MVFFKLFEIDGGENFFSPNWEEWNSRFEGLLTYTLKQRRNEVYPIRFKMKSRHFKILLKDFHKVLLKNHDLNLVYIKV